MKSYERLTDKWINSETLNLKNESIWPIKLFFYISEYGIKRISEEVLA